MGVFDKNSLKYNDAIPNPNKEDGIDNVKCDNIECNCSFFFHNKYLL